MPSSQSPLFFLGAAVAAAAVGLITAVGMFINDRYKQEKLRHGMAQDIARMDQQMAAMKKELERLRNKEKQKFDLNLNLSIRLLFENVSFF